MKQINIDNASRILRYIVKNNKELTAKNLKPNAVSLIGAPGIGKTAIVEEVARENEMSFGKIVLSQCEEIGDLIGSPVKEFYMCGPSGNCKWVAAEVVEYYIQSGWTMNENSTPRMSYALPEWVPTEENPNGTILLLDDWTRALPIFIQAVMELIDKQQFMSWTLPENTTIVLTANPDNGDFNVSSIDSAQRTRYMEFEMEFDIECWAKWAEKIQLRGSGINFALSYPEIFKTKNEVQMVNSRSFVAFINAISGLDDWSDTKNLAFILMLSKGCFPEDETNVVGSLFTTFINNKLDRLISPEDILNKDWDFVKRTIKNSVYDGDKYRADIAATLANRFVNYIELYFDKKGNKDIVVDRILDFVECEEKLLTEDILFNTIATLHAKHASKITKLLTNKKVIKNVIL